MRSYSGITKLGVALAGLLAHAAGLLPAASRPLVYRADLDQVHAQDRAAYGGPRPARAVLDLAAAAEAAGYWYASRLA